MHVMSQASRMLWRVGWVTSSRHIPLWRKLVPSEHARDRQKSVHGWCRTHYELLWDTHCMLDIQRAIEDRSINRTYVKVQGIVDL
jgi:hypothetical protein